MARLRDRSTTDLLILMIAGTICTSVLAAGATIGVIEVIDPSVDTSQAVGTLSDVINTLIGLLAGFLAGRTATVQELTHHQRMQQKEKDREEGDEAS